MKFRLRTKLLKGKPRWYLVRSEYDKGTGARRPVWIYIGPPPNGRIRNLVSRLNRAKDIPARNRIIAKIKAEKIELSKRAKIERKKKTTVRAWERRAAPIIRAAEEHFKKAVEEIKMSRINQLNAARAWGQGINVASGRERLIFNLWGREYCRRELLPDMPDRTIAELRAAVSLASNIKEPVESFPDYLRWARALKPQFVALGLDIME